MWGKVLIWVLLLPYYLKGLCDVGALRSLAICHLQFLVFAVLSRHVPALNVFPCGVPMLLQQTILGQMIPKRWKSIMTSNFYVHILLYMIIWFIQILNRCFHYLHYFLCTFQKYMKTNWHAFQVQTEEKLPISQHLYWQRFTNPL